MRKILVPLAGLFIIASLSGNAGCSQEAVSNSGVGKATVSIPVGSDGLTAEQRNVGQRLLIDNKPGAIKHLYVISAYSGQVLIYSTVKEKVSSSGKRLTPSHVLSNIGYFDVYFNGYRYGTDEVMSDDGTYGSSDPYIFWWDSKGVYHQHFIAGGQIIHVSDQPLAVKSIVLNMESTEK